jgi:hypothetical protein
MGGKRLTELGYLGGIARMTTREGNGADARLLVI